MEPAITYYGSNAIVGRAEPSPKAHASQTTPTKRAPADLANSIKFTCKRDQGHPRQITNINYYNNVEVVANLLLQVRPDPKTMPPAHAQSTLLVWPSM